MSCQALRCKEKAKFENGIGVQVCSTKCASKLAPDARLITAEQHHTLDHPSDPSLIHIHKTSPMIGIYRNEPTLILRKDKTHIDQCVSAERPDYFEVNKNVANALKTALVGISKEEIEAELAKTRREAEELARKRQELQRQLDQVKEEERKQKMDESQAKKSAKQAEKEQKEEERRRRKEENRKRRNEKARLRYQEAKEKDAAKRAAEGGGGDSPRKKEKETGKQLVDLNTDVLLVMIAQLDDASLRSLAMVNHRFNDLAFPSLFEKSTSIGKMRFIFLAILNENWKRVAYAFSKYDRSKFRFRITSYFRKLFMWSSPWEKARKFEDMTEERSALSAWDEIDSSKLSATQVEKALDLFIRIAFYKENTEGERQPMVTPIELRPFVQSIMQNLTVFHHLSMLNRFFDDPVWRGTIVINPTIAKQEMMVYSAYAGFAEFVAQVVTDPTIDVTYHNSSVFGVLVGKKNRSPYYESDMFLTSEGSEGPTDIKDELNRVVQVLLQSGRPFEMISPDNYVDEPEMFHMWDDWWDTESKRPIVMEDGQLDYATTSKKNTTLANAVFNKREEIIDIFLPRHPAERLTDDANLARMLVYYYPDVTKTQSLDMFDRVMKQSNNTLVPVDVAAKMMYTADTYLHGYPPFESQSRRRLNLSQLKEILLRDSRLNSQQRRDIQNAYDTVIGVRLWHGDDRFADYFDLIEEEDAPYNDADKYPDPWTTYWNQVAQASAMEM